VLGSIPKRQQGAPGTMASSFTTADGSPAQQPGEAVNSSFLLGCGLHRSWQEELQNCCLHEMLAGE